MSILIMILAFAGFLEFGLYGTASIWLLTIAATLAAVAVKKVFRHD